MARIEKRVECSQCGKMVGASGMGSHMRTHRLERGPSSPFAGKGKRWVKVRVRCPVCKEIICAGALGRHRLTHHKGAEKFDYKKLKLADKPATMPMPLPPRQPLTVICCAHCVRDLVDILSTADRPIVLVSPSPEWLPVLEDCLRRNS